MSDSTQDVTLAIQARRFVQLRFPLFALLAVNALFIIGVPVIAMQRKMIAAVTGISESDPLVTNDVRSTPTTETPSDPELVEAVATVKTTVNPDQAESTGSTQDQSNEHGDVPADEHSSDPVEPADSETNTDSTGQQDPPADVDGGVEQSVEPADKIDPPSDTELEPQGVETVETASTSGETSVAGIETIDSTDSSSNQASFPVHRFPDFPRIRLPHFESVTSLFGTPHRTTNKNEDSPSESELVITNPSEWGVPVHFAINDEIYTLNPGESRNLDVGQFQRVHFHRGEDFGDAEYLLSRGDYKFHVTENGWALVARDNL